MKTSTVSEIQHELLKSLKVNYFDVQRYKQIIKALQRCNQTMVGDALIEFLGDKKGSGFAAQDLAGKLLFELKPDTSRSLDEIIRNTLPNWDKSVEELPWYLALKFGESEFRKTLANIRAGADEGIMDLAKTFEWWLGWIPK
ncbi:MAG: hypothetical protein GY757_00145 [bacterium]|nr:hypothetical protein [bacterium]